MTRNSWVEAVAVREAAEVERCPPSVLVEISCKVVVTAALLNICPGTQEALHLEYILSRQGRIFCFSRLHQD